MPTTLRAIAAAGLAAMTMAPVPVAAQDITITRQLSIALASEAAPAALATCRQQGYRVSVAVYDRSGLIGAREEKRACAFPLPSGRGTG